ncbi:O-antigen ligase family protein [Natronospira bacteriovora]|uniref:O-antigen ligase family protein n=1 Tax=Natronospira bacteriovora TaxID=3069753 RepID=A0ABU0W7X9_9GAMM|nr:O-antigen ligase family protein [Natronospira sp. AB-CW4]MDQ2070114.1 O-antigen ligase family protein [Natronospira sp. AB-CW4]
MVDGGLAGLIREWRDWWGGLGAWPRVVAVTLLLAPLCLLLWREARYLTLLVLALPGLWYGFRIGFLAFPDRAGRRVLWLVWLFLAVGLLSWAANGFVEGGVDRFARHNRLLIFLPLLITLLWLRPPRHWLWAVLGLAGLGFGLAAGLEVLQADQGFAHRVGGDANELVFGLLCTLLAAALAVAAWQHRGQPLLALWLLAGMLAAALGLVLSGMRIGLPALALALPVAALVLWRRGDGRAALLFLVLPLLFLPLLVLVVGQGMQARFATGLDQARDYFSVEGRMPPRVEAVAGCQDDPRLLQASLSAFYTLQRGLETVEVLPGAADAPCGEGARFRLRAGESHARFYLPRQLPIDVGRADGLVMARGEGARLRLRDGEWQTVDASLARLSLASDRIHRSRIEIDIAPGGWLEWVPEARWPGEYRYPHVFGSMSQRLEMWRIALAAFAERPLLGHGTGSFNEIARVRIEAGAAPHVMAHYDHAHSEYLEALATRGVPGVLMLIALLAALMHASLRSGPQALPFLASWTALAVIFVTEASLSSNLPTVSIAFLMALALYFGQGSPPAVDWSRNRLRPARRRVQGGKGASHD